MAKSGVVACPKCGQSSSGYLITSLNTIAHVRCQKCSKPFDIIIKKGEVAGTKV